MKLPPMLIVLIAMAIPVSTDAKIPRINATCPGNLEIHVDEDGPVFLNGKEATLKAFTANYYEAKLGQVTISLTINPDGSAAISYAGPGRDNGVCRVKDR